MLGKRPDPLDIMVGTKIRIFRTDRRMSQSDLAEKIDVAFQQVQKYENGTNRVGASRLSRIADALNISVGELFESPEHKPADTKQPFLFPMERDSLRVLKAFSRTTDPRLRRAIAQLLETIADQQARQAKVKASIARPAAAKRVERRQTTVATRIRPA
jgi:transcriptional regulator with XRE-family HTH domain